MSEREERIGRWVSGVAHGALILWAVLGGALFRPQSLPPIRSTQVSTISGAEFDALAAASRGAGPVAPDATAVANLPMPSGDEGAEAPASSTAPEARDVAELTRPDAAEPAPDLGDFAAREPVAVASDLAQPPVAQTESPAESPSVPAAAETAPRPGATPSLEAPAPPRSALALAVSPRPQQRPDDLVEAFNRRLAEREAAEAAARQAAAEAAEAERRAAAEREAEERRRSEAAEAERRAAAEREAEERRRAEAAEAERRAAAEREAEERRRAEAAEAERRAAAEREAEERRRAEAAEAERRAAAEREAEERRRAEAAEAERRAAAEREAEERRRAEAAEAERRAAAEREAEERRRAEAAEAERRAAAEREAADRRALEDALREAQQDNAGAGGTDTASTGDAFGGDRQRIEGGDGASAGLDPLAAALAGALSGNGGEAPAPDAMQFAPSGISATPLPEPQNDAALGGLPVGAPLSLAEREGLRMAIERCWNVGALSVEAAQTSVTVAFSLGPDGVPEPASMRIADFNGGSPNAAQQAFDVARRAILMCGRAGYALPAEKYARWRDVEVSFRPGGVEF